jgi:hypothetical protein
MGSEKRNVSYRLPVDLIRAVEEEAIEEGRTRQSGLVFKPSSVVERILRAHYAAKPKRERRAK